MMEVGELISFYRRQSGMTIDELAGKSGVPKGTLNKIIGGVTKAPTLDNMKAIARALGKRLSDFDDAPETADMFSPSEQDHIKKYRSLDPYGQEAVDGVLDVEYRRCEEERKAQKDTLRESRAQIELSEEIEPTVFFVVPKYDLPMSAGTGVQAGEEFPENYRLIKEPPRGTSYIAPISGNSMEPTFFNGQLVFVHATGQIPIGKVGVFFMDGQQWIKELGEGVLIPHNKIYDPIQITEDFRCQGLVLDVCDDSYFE